MREDRHLGPDRTIERLGCAEFDAVEDGERCRVVAQRVGEHSRANRCNGGADQDARGRHPVVAIPRLHCARVCQQPRFAEADLIARSAQHVDQAHVPRSSATQPYPVEQDRQSGLDPDQPRQSLGSARARQQADERFGQTHCDLGVVDQDTVVRGHRQFASTAQRNPGDCRSNRLARRLQFAHRMAEAKEMIEGEIEARALGSCHDHVIGKSELREIGAGTKAIGLAGPDQHALDVGLRQPGREGPEFLDRGIRENIHRPPGTIEDEMHQSIARKLEPELGQCRRSSHAIAPDVSRFVKIRPCRRL